MNMKSDDIYKQIEDDIDSNHGLMKDAWIVYKGEKWYPVIVTDRVSKVSGFEVNFSGQWGPNHQVGRQKLPLAEFLDGLSRNIFPSHAGLRCKRINDNQRNGRDLADIQLSPRAKVLLDRIRHGTSGSLTALTGAPPLQEADSRAPQVQHAAVDTGVPETDQRALEGDTASLSSSEREAVVKVRFGQGTFRASLLDKAGEVCWMSGIEGKELLIASHIQPWAHCGNHPDARGCPDNGLLLSSLWDAAFDAGLVTFDEAWQAIPSPRLSETAKKHLGLEEQRFLPAEFRNARRAGYLAYHRREIFKQ